MNNSGGNLEIIHLRLAANCPEDLLDTIRDSATDLPAGTALNIFRCHDLSGDISVHILHQSIDGMEVKSSLGIQLASELREFGIVYHSLWIEEPEFST